MTPHVWRQILAVIRLELRKTFFARRGLWVYLLALAPVLLYLGNSIYAPREQARLARLAQAHPVSSAALHSIQRGLSPDEVIQKLGQPYSKRIDHRRIEGGQFNEHVQYRYTDGKSDFAFRFFNGELRRIERDDIDTLAGNRLIFATIFQFYYLRLAVLFGCVGVFMNLFRGEMLDKSLHFYLLTPMRREVLVAGKYIAGLIAITVIFMTSTALQFPAMLWEFDKPTVAAYLSGPGWSDLTAYLGVTALACVGYGSIFLAAGLLLRNPIVAAAIVLLWESANLFLPVALKKLSLIFYLQSLCPVAPPADTNLPIPMTLLISTANPAGKAAAVSGILIFSLLVLVVSSLWARKLEINYSSD